MNNYYIEHVKFKNGTDKFEVRMMLESGGNHLVTTRYTIEDARQAIQQLDGYKEVSRVRVE